MHVFSVKGPVVDEPFRKVPMPSDPTPDAHVYRKATAKSSREQSRHWLCVSTDTHLPWILRVSHNRRDPDVAESHLKRARMLGPSAPLNLYVVAVIVVGRAYHHRGQPTMVVNIAGPSLPSSWSILLPKLGRIQKLRSHRAISQGARAARGMRRSLVVVAVPRRHERLGLAVRERGDERNSVPGILVAAAARLMQYHRWVRKHETQAAITHWSADSRTKLPIRLWCTLFPPPIPSFCC